MGDAHAQAHLVGPVSQCCQLGRVPNQAADIVDVAGPEAEVAEVVDDDVSAKMLEQMQRGRDPHAHAMDDHVNAGGIASVKVASITAGVALKVEFHEGTVRRPQHWQLVGRRLIGRYSEVCGRRGAANRDKAGSQQHPICERALTRVNPNV